MSWKKHLRVVKTIQTPQRVAGPGASTTSGSNYSSFLPEYYAGHPNRLQRYQQYDEMDRDSIINAALDIIADFCTQSEEQNDAPFMLDWDEQATDAEVSVVNKALDSWVKMNAFKSRLWFIFRQTIKYGDQFFIRDPETGEWDWVDQYCVEAVKIDQESGNSPVDFIIKNLSLFKASKIAAKEASGTSVYSNGGGVLTPFNKSTSPTPGGAFNLVGTGAPQSTISEKPFEVDAKHVVHLSIGVGMDGNWPFGASILEPIFKTFKQKELLEDASIIYRVQRAPERRVFQIDVGGMNPAMADAHLARVKNEVHQRRIPNRNGTGGNIMDAAYNPLTMMEDFFFAVTSDGRGSKVEVLPGGSNVGEISDLKFFTDKLKSGLRIPNAYLPGTDTESAAYNDGKVGTALIQEYIFNKYCLRLQALLVPAFAKDFEWYLQNTGVNVDSSLFELKFNPPQNFSKYRQMEVDSSQMSIYTQIADNDKLSERFKLTRFLGLTQEEILLNERMWAEENPSKIKAATGDDGDIETPSTSSVGIRPQREPEEVAINTDEIGDTADGAGGDSNE